MTASLSYIPPNGEEQKLERQGHSGLAVTALTLGIVALVFSIIPLINFLSFPLSVLAIVFGIIALSKKVSKGMAIAGVVLGGVAFLLTTVFFVILAIFMGQVGEISPQPSPPASSTASMPSPAALVV